jgi:hypothetical protein
VPEPPRRKKTNRQGRQEHQGKQKNLSPQRRKGAEERKGNQKQNQIRISEVLCGFSLRLRAFAVIAFLCVSSATSAPLRLSLLIFVVLGALAIQPNLTIIARLSPARYTAAQE